MTASRRFRPPRPGGRPPDYRPALTIMAMTIVAAGAVALLRPPRLDVEPSPTPSAVVSPSPSPTATSSPSPGSPSG